MNHFPPTIPPVPPPINRPQQGSEIQAWMIAAGVLCVVLLVALLLFFTVRSPNQTGNSHSASASSSGSVEAGEPAASASPLADETGLGESTATDAVAKQAKSAPVEQPDVASANADPTIETETEDEDADLTSNQPGKINNSLENSPPGRRFFGIPATGEHIGFVIDRSSSMESGNRLKRANKELLRAISNLQVTTKVSVVYYGSHAETNKEFTAFEPTKDRIEGLARWSASIKPFGGTDPVPAIKIISRYDCDQVFILSDGEFLPQAVTQIAAENHKRVPINTVSLRGDSRSLKQIAAQNNGTFRSSKNWVPPAANRP